MLPAAMARRAALPAALFVFCALVYVLVLGERAWTPSPDNHFVHLAESFLEGQLSVLGYDPPGNNDWARYEGTWYVSFPAFPALVIAPAVAIFGTATLDRLFWAMIAALAPALLYVLLRRLSERGLGVRTPRENLVLALLFAFGTVFFYSAVQGTVWFAAHMVAVNLLILMMLFGFEARRPMLAGLCLGLCFLTRTTTALGALFFAVEAIAAHRRTDRPLTPSLDHPLRIAARYVADADLPKVLKSYALFALPVLCAIGVQLWMNAARFDDPLTFGHEYLQIKWRGRIETWGLFDYHYLSKNLAVFLASLPWLSSEAPHIKVSLHGLALWFTTPNLLLVLWPKRVDVATVSLALPALLICLLNLCYQNSGWIQFGYRFALDYMPMLIVLLALGMRRFGPIFYTCMALAVAINAFGAFTFDRAWQFYDNDRTQNRLFQPD
jgi:hypothetical protein